MNAIFVCTVSRCVRFVVCVLALVLSNLAVSGPGAHGPGGEHLDQTPGAAGAGTAKPRFEAATDLFELVAVLADGELSILIDRFETNAPVLEAVVEVESGGKKAGARFHADHGNYAVDDPAFLAVLARPGEHAVVVSVASKDEYDLLNGTLVVSDSTGRHASHTAEDPSHAQTLERVLIVGAGILVVVVIVAFWQRRRIRRRRRDGATLEVQP